MERLSGRDLPGVLLLPVGLAAVLVVARVLVVAEFLVNLALPLIALIALVGLVLARDRLRALRFDPWAAAAAVGVAFLVAAPGDLVRRAEFTGSLVLGDTAHQLALADRLGEAGTQSQPPPDSSYGLTVRKYFDHRLPHGSAGSAGAPGPPGAPGCGVAVPAFPGAAGGRNRAGAQRSFVSRRSAPARARALVAFIASQPALVIAFALQGSIKEMTALAGISLTFALVALMLVERWPARASVLPLCCRPWRRSEPSARRGWSTSGPRYSSELRQGSSGCADSAPPRAVRHGRCRLRCGVAGAAGARRRSRRRSRPTTRPFRSGNLLGNLPRPLDVLHALGAWPVGDYRYAPLHPKATAALALLVGAVAAFGLIMAIRRRALGPLLLTGTTDADLSPAVVARKPLRGRKGPGARFDRRAAAGDAGRRVAALFKRARTTLSVLRWRSWSEVRSWSTNVLAYHDAQLAPYDRYRDNRRLRTSSRGAGRSSSPSLTSSPSTSCAALKCSASPNGRSSSRPGRSTRRAQPTRLAANTDGLHPSLKSPLDPDGIALTTLGPHAFLCSVAPQRLRVPRPTIAFAAASVTTRSGNEPRSADSTASGARRGVFQPGSRPSCRLVKRFAAKAEDEGAQIAYARASGRPSSTTRLKAGSRTEGFGEVEYELYPKSVATGSAGRLSPAIRVPETGRYCVWVLGSFTREVAVFIDGRRVGGVSYESANQGAYLRLGAIELTEGLHRLELTRAGGDLRPGSGGGDRSHLAFLGPVVLSPRTTADARFDTCRHATRSACADNASTGSRP